jgi:hypothetical protein
VYGKERSYGTRAVTHVHENVRFARRIHDRIAESPARHNEPRTVAIRPVTPRT